ncbi:hypothetical protein CEXT_651441 [Caerostris extrusa]|uniref:Uncharacterized protein n=1 Tax=Caerostris extrusa TaxID=172846 RepID=A0AAV4TB70_CAEEX|nr:hypothetical protein CEXT_651441 [Caerostris extrusa]
MDLHTISTNQGLLFIFYQVKVKEGKKKLKIFPSIVPRNQLRNAFAGGDSALVNKLPIHIQVTGFGERVTAIGASSGFEEEGRTPKGVLGDFQSTLRRHHVYAVQLLVQFITQ